MENCFLNKSGIVLLYFRKDILKSTLQKSRRGWNPCPSLLGNSFNATKKPKLPINKYIITMYILPTFSREDDTNV